VAAAVEAAGATGAVAAGAGGITWTLGTSSVL